MQPGQARQGGHHTMPADGAAEELTDPQLERYARHVVLPELGEAGQLRLLAARVLVVGAGGLGAPLLLYLAAAGVGTLGLVDDDVVDLSNLQRQVIHDGAALGRPKVESAAARIAALNPDVRVEIHQGRLDATGAAALIARYDLVCDGSDNFATRYLLNDACFLARRPLVSGAIMRFDGQLATFRAYAGDGTPCYRCVFGDQPEDPKQSCADVGVLGALPGIVGSLQAMEVIKELLGIGTGMAGRLLLYDGLHATFRMIRTRADPACPLCGPQASISSLDPARYQSARSCHV